jgi:hypothetical protein
MDGSSHVSSASRKTPKQPSAEAERRLAYFAERRDQMVSTIRELVEIESPSDTKPPSTAWPRRSRTNFRGSAAKSVSTAARSFGSHLQSTLAATRPSQFCLLGHYDTVYPLGTLAHMPCRVERNMLTGPGVLDMKSGIALMLHALAALARIGTSRRWQSHGEIAASGDRAARFRRGSGQRALRDPSPRRWPSGLPPCSCSSHPTATRRAP